MMIVTNLKPVNETIVGMGQIVFGQAPDRLVSILGSCIGVSSIIPARDMPFWPT